jgi:hypothetical protein
MRKAPPGDGEEPFAARRPFVRSALTLDARQDYLDVMTATSRAVPGAGRLDSLCCSFCNKDKDQVAKLIAGPGVYVCNECVGLCNAILAAEEQGPSQPAAWDDKPDEELLAGLRKTQAVVSQVDAAMRDHVAVLREHGVSWTRIGEALGVSKQAAWERFSGED